jgi:phosphoribosylanthranilate isomerase
MTAQQPKPLVKVCGITHPGDAAMCTALGATWLGFIFHAPSPRNVAPALPARITEAPEVRKVGVCVGQSAEEVNRTLREGRLHLAQLAGGQDAAFCEAVGPERVVRVLWPERHESAAALQAEIDAVAGHCAYLLFDAGTSGGGHGRPLALDFLREITIPVPWLLAGGLGPATIGAALRANPHGVDLNSGVESSPGRKDRHKLAATLEQINEQR